MEPYRNDSFVSHHPASSAVDEMQPSTERVAKQCKQRKRPSAREQAENQEGLEKKEVFTLINHVWLLAKKKTNK
jgi:hypothetical protein